MIEPITNIALYLGDILFQELVITNLNAKLKEEILKRKIFDLINTTLKETLPDIPGFQSEIETGSFIIFLSSSAVLNDLKKLISVRGGEPNISFLCEEWLKIDPSPRGNRKLLLEIFLTRLAKRLREIPELQENLFKKDILVANATIGAILPTVAAQVNELYENQSNYQAKSPEDIKLSGQLDACKDLFSRNFPRAALDLLWNIEKEIEGRNVTGYLRYRLNNLIGGCEYSLGNNQEAINRLQTALSFMPTDPKALANAALAMLLGENYENAIELANQSIANGGEDTGAMAIRVQAMAHQNNYQNLDALVDEHCFGNCDYVRALGYIFHRQKDFISAEKFYKLAISQNSNDYHSLMGLAQAILEKHFTKFIIDQDTLTEAEKYIDLASDIAKRGDNQVLISDALAAKGGLFLTRGDHSKALDYCDDVLKTTPTHKLALHNRAIIAMVQHDYLAALNFFEKLPEEYKIQFLAFPISDAFITIGKPESALDILYKYKKTGTNPTAEAYIAKALIALNRTTEAEAIKQSLLAGQSDIEHSLAAAEIANAQGGFAEAASILEKVFSGLNIDDPNRVIIIIRLGLLHYFHQEFEKSISWFNLISDHVVNDIDLSRIYIRALYSAKKYADAYKTLQTIRAAGIQSIEFLEIESWLAEYFGNVKIALGLQKQLIELEPENLIYKVQLAQLEFRAGNRPEALKILNGINLEEIENPSELIQIANMFRFFEEPESAIKTAYRARHLGQNLPETHIAYISIFLNTDNQLKEFLERSKVEDNSALLLKSEEKEYWFKLLTLVTPDEGKWEFSPNSDIGKILLDHQVGEKIEFKSTPLETIEYTITQIQSIYVRAFQESFDEFGTRFPERNDIQKVHITDGDLSKVFIQTFQYSNLAELVYKGYEQGALSISQFASLIGRNPIDIFTSILATKNQRVFASFGTPEDQQQQLKVVETTDSITLDITSLITIDYLEAFDILVSRFKKIYISQYSLDILEQTIAERYFDLRKGKRSIGFYEGRPFFEEIPTYALEQNLTFITGLLTFTKTKCELVQIPAELTKYLMVSDDPLISMNKPSISTILVAKHTNTPLFADDARLRVYAEKELSVFGFWSQSFLVDCNNKNLISKTQYHEVCIKLLGANFYFVSTNSDMIIEILKENSYVPNAKVLAILSGLKPDTNEADAVNIGSQVIKNVWLSGVPQREFVTGLILQILCEGRNKRRVIVKSIRTLDQILALAAANHDQILNYVKQWYKVNPQ